MDDEIVYLDSMLTTADNPYNPYTQFDEWFNFDHVNGYNTYQRLAKIANLSYRNNLDKNKELLAIAMNEMLKEDLLGIYLKVNRQNAQTIIDKLRKANENETQKKDTIPSES